MVSFLRLGEKMKSIIIEGARRLEGDVSVSGSKNAVLPIIFACILTNGVSKIENIPDIGDVSVALEIISALGAMVERRENIAMIDTRNMSYRQLSKESVAKIRASTYLIGSCLSRFGVCHLLPFGGCGFSHRPIDLHLMACRSLGGEVRDEAIYADSLVGGEIIFPIRSVGATVNAILLAASADGDSVIKGCATEPHIDSLIEFINSAGGSVRRQGSTVYVSGRSLQGGEICIFGDMIEAGSYLGVGLMSGGEVKIKNCPVDQMDSVFSAFRSLGAEICFDKDYVSARMSSEARSIVVNAEPYPGFPTDLQPIFAPIMAWGMGGKIFDFVWENRFGYLDNLSCFGVKCKRYGNTAEIFTSKIHPSVSDSPDLRGGFACLMCALMADGVSRIDSAEIILRGYEGLEAKLSKIGARIKITD